MIQHRNVIVLLNAGTDEPNNVGMRRWALHVSRPGHRWTTCVGAPHCLIPNRCHCFPYHNLDSV